MNLIRKATEEEINRLKIKYYSILNLYNRFGEYPYELYTLLSTYAINESIPFDMKTYLKLQ